LNKLTKEIGLGNGLEGLGSLEVEEFESKQINKLLFFWSTPFLQWKSRANKQIRQFFFCKKKTN